MMNFEKDSKKRDRSAIAAELLRAGAVNVDRKSLRCPFHDDKTPSADIRETPNGFWYFHCYTCDISADVYELRARIEGKDVSEILREEFNDKSDQPVRRATALPKREPEPEKESASFESYDEALAEFWHRYPNAVLQEENPYRTYETDQVEYYVLRYLPKPGVEKKFMPVSLRDGRWRFEHPKGLRPLFNSLAVKAANGVLIVEGEKCVREFKSHMTFPKEILAATTCSGGANSVDRADLSILVGKQVVYIWADNDAPGQKCFDAYKARIEELDPSIIIVRVRVEDLGLPEKGDIVDLLGEFPGTKEQRTDFIGSILESGEQMNGIEEMKKHYQDVKDGLYRNIHFPNMPVLSHQSKALLPGSIVCLCGDPNAAKSLMLSEWFLEWSQGEDVKADVLMLEEGKLFYQKRAHQQLSGAKIVNDVDLHAANPEVADELLKQYEAQLIRFSRCLTVTNSQQMTYEQILEWAEKKFKAGTRVIGIDPITGATPTANPWIADSIFVFRLKAMLDEYGASAILTTHPRGTAKKADLSSVGGGLAFTRFTQVVLWLSNLDKMTDSRVLVDAYATLMKSHKQIIDIKKARSGIGRGRQMAVNFDTKSLRFEEIGLIANDDY